MISHLETEFNVCLENWFSPLVFTNKEKCYVKKELYFIRDFLHG